MSMPENESNNNSSSIIPFVCFIIGILVLANTSIDTWDEVGHQCYINYILFTLSASLAVIVLICGGVCLTMCSKNETLLSCIGFSVPVIFLLTAYALMGIIWHEDPEHSVLFYKEFWTEWAFDIPKGTSGVTYFRMGDVVIRIYSTTMILLTFMMPCIIPVVITLIRASCSREPTLPMTSTGIGSF